MQKIFSNRGVRVAGIMLGAILITGLGIDASDTLQGVRGTLLSQLIESKPVALCPEGMEFTDMIPTLTCIDRFEASPSTDCPHDTLSSTLQSEENIAAPGCAAASVEAVAPWTYISLPQAQRACAGAGKRLPTPEEWYRIALGTNADTCVIDTSESERSGASTACISAVGAYDTVGNVWEWVDAQVTNTTYDNRTLPDTGYVTSVDAHGIAVTTAEAPDALYGTDYFWSKSEGVFGILRGGFYGSQGDAGLYALNASVPTTFTAQGVGFRCVR